MRASTLLRRSLTYHWRANLAVVAGVATAASVLAGALAVGDSVRESLANTALLRLGRTRSAVEAAGSFREALAEDLGRRLRVPSVPLLFRHGIAVHASTGRRASEVLVYGVDQRFWSFHQLPRPALEGREALLSEALSSELRATAGDTILLRLESASELPGSSLFGRRDAPAPALRVTTREVLPRSQLGEFALHPSRDAVRAAFVPLELLQRALGVAGRANTVLLAAPGDDRRVASALAEAVRLEDLGLRVRALGAAGALQLDSASTLLDDVTAAAARQVAAAQGLRVGEVLIYLANSIRRDDRDLPYALVAALDDDALRSLAGQEVDSEHGPVLVLNDWSAADLEAAPGADLDLEYYLWLEEGRLETRSAAFRLASVVPIRGLAADRDLVPEYPGITDAPQVSDWDPPFPVDLRRIRPRDEAYWDQHRTTPKAFVSLKTGQELWGHRLGQLTTMRFTPEPGVDLETARGRFATALRAALTRDAATPGAGPRLADVRAAALEAARGSTDFGEYFVYFSFFLVAAALLLAGLFFRLGIEQRQREVGLLGALGYSTARLRWQYLAEGATLAGLGAALGAGGALVYSAAVLLAVRTLWSQVLPTADLSLHVSARSLGLGVLGAGIAAVLAVLWTLHDVQRLSVRALLAGAREVWDETPATRGLAWPITLSLAAAIVLWAASGDQLPQSAAFFVSGGLLLAGAVLASRRVVSGRPRGAAALHSVAALGRRGAAYRPGRSVLCVALLASATFVIVSVGAFRREHADTSHRQGEAGGYSLLAWSLLPLQRDPASPEAQESFDLSPAELRGVAIARFRASRGEDASCLNLHRPGRPTLLAPGSGFLRENRFSFQASIAQTPAERENPWLLLEREPVDGALPAIADASSLAYVLHRKLGEVMELGDTGVRLRFVGALDPGLFQGEILVGEGPFLQAFPQESGYRFFLIETPASRVAPVAAHLEQRLGDFGLDVTETAARLAAFHRVENTYISTFQALGALGLLLGTVGLATVLVRNALEQRRELALLRAVGYHNLHLLKLLLAENALLILLGLAAGALPALLAITPALASQGSTRPVALLGVLAGAVVTTGALVSWLAVAVVRRMPLLSSLRAE